MADLKIELGLEPETLRRRSRYPATNPPLPRVNSRCWLRHHIEHEDTDSSLHTFIASIFEHMTIARAEKKEIQCTMSQNVGLPSPGISKLTVSLKLQWLKNILTNNLSRTRLRLLMRFICDENNLIVEDNH
ncbi:hypothetical protein AVEN_10670-1 [Araneus ventricosus]|uniref:Uncharacterized protein n=1 Tax=Araneus ventricosus TaxID=182803 RepID=A0A4Y2EV00_ARAVE|nr:hypothetical protein AVEN_10670-1 [Araneus ventricosus]